MLSLANTLLNSKLYTIQQALLKNLVNRLQSSLRVSNNTIYSRWYTSQVKPYNWKILTDTYLTSFFQTTRTYWNLSESGTNNTYLIK